MFRFIVVQIYLY